MFTQLLNKTESFISTPIGLKKSFTRTALAFLFGIIIFGIIIGLNATYGVGGSATSGTLRYNLIYNEHLVNIASIFCYISLSLIIFPFVSLIGIWIIGVNNTTKTPAYNLFIWISAAIVILFSIIAIIIFIRASVYNLDDLVS